MPMNETQTARAEALRPLFRNMDPHTAQEIRESYYRIAENPLSVTKRALW